MSLILSFSPRQVIACEELLSPRLTLKIAEFTVENKLPEQSWACDLAFKKRHLNRQVSFLEDLKGSKKTQVGVFTWEPSLTPVIETANICI